MYPCNFEFLMPDDIESIIEGFFTKFILPFSEDNSKDAEEFSRDLEIFRELENDSITPFCLLQLIKYILEDGNEEYGRYLFAITSYLNKLIEIKNTIKRNCDCDQDYQKAFSFSVFYLLPHAAKFFSETDQIQCFTQLFSGLYLYADIGSEEVIDEFNQYIDLLLNSEDIHQIIIMMYFASQFQLNESNEEKVANFIKTILTQLCEFNLSNELEKIMYLVLFRNLDSFLSSQLIENKIELSFFCESIDRFLNAIISKSGSSQDNLFFDNEIELLDVIILYFYAFVNTFCKEIDKENCEESRIYIIISNMIELIYKKAYNLIEPSKYLLSKSISSLLIIGIPFYSYIEESEYLVELIFQLSFLSQSDIEEINESEEMFFFDFYDINFDYYDDFSSRQSLSLFIFEYIKYAKNYDLIHIISEYLNSIESDQINESHLYILSILNKVAMKFRINDEDTLSILRDLTIEFISNGCEFVSNIESQNDFHSLYNIIYILSYYLLINSSFYIIKNNEIDESLYNNELVRIISIFENQTVDFDRTFFTFFCIIANNLFDFEMLKIPALQALRFADKNVDLCFTNHAITLICKFSICTENIELLIETFRAFMIDCTESINELTEFLKTQGNNEEDELIFNTSDRESEYILRYFNDNVRKMSLIIDNIDIEHFDEEELKEFAFLLITKGECNWPFVKESNEFMSAVLSKTGNLKEMTEFYYETVSSVSRIDNNYSEWIVPIIAAVSKRPDLVDQEYFDFIWDIMKMTVEVYTNPPNNYVEHDYMATLDALITFSLVSRLFELSINNQFNVSEENFSFFMKLADEIQPVGEYDELEDINTKDQELGFIILKLSSYLVIHDVDQDELIKFLFEIANEGKIVAEEMRFIIIYLIDNLLDAENNAEIAELRNSCLNNNLAKDTKYLEMYYLDRDYFVNYIKHPIFKLVQIEGFVEDNFELKLEEEE